MAAEKILVIEDEEPIRELLKLTLESAGYSSIYMAANGEDGLRLAQARLPDLILLDLMLPEIDGLEVCRRLKREPETATIPVVMLTAKGEESDIVAGLELGADDYITKPFSPKVLVARIRAVLRRNRRGMAGEEATLNFDDLTIHPGRHEVLYQDNLIELTYSEFAILHLLARRPGWVFTRYRIVDAIRGEQYAVSERAVDVQIAGLRKKLGDAGDYIKTVRGVGYKFVDQDAVSV